jgi:hypothetical protein
LDIKYLIGFITKMIYYRVRQSIINWIQFWYIWVRPVIQVIIFVL